MLWLADNLTNKKNVSKSFSIVIWNIQMELVNQLLGKKFKMAGWKKLILILYRWKKESFEKVRQ